MGFFSLKAICCACEKECGLNRYRISNKRWICRDCFKKSGGNRNFAVIRNKTTKELKDMLYVPTPITDERVLEIIGEGTAGEKLQRLIISEPDISLKKDEVCYYADKAYAFNIKNVVIGRKNAGSGVSFRVSKGVSLRTGGGASEVIRGNVSEKFDGKLYITNKRMVLLTSKYGFDLSLTKISQFSPKADGFKVFEGAKCHSVLTPDVKLIVKIIQLMNEVSDETEKAKEKTSVVDVSKELRELKKLLDDAIITEEEFQTKKEQLLGL